ncbi:hypothetical protein HPB49_026583 [Dermacentor silvarum]|nr:hypothetical protein HPB49_026583 [Dermacentor silvarum]
MDSHLLQLWKAKAGLERRWQRQRWNTTFRRRLTQLNKETETHAATLSRQNWGSLCNRLEHNMSLPQTWNLFHHLIDSTQSKTHQTQIMTKLIDASEASPQELLQTLRAGEVVSDACSSGATRLTGAATKGQPSDAKTCRMSSCRERKSVGRSGEVQQALKSSSMDLAWSNTRTFFKFAVARRQMAHSSSQYRRAVPQEVADVSLKLFMAYGAGGDASFRLVHVVLAMAGIALCPSAPLLSSLGQDVGSLLGPGLEDKQLAGSGQAPSRTGNSGSPPGDLSGLSRPAFSVAWATTQVDHLT